MKQRFKRLANVSSTIATALKILILTVVVSACARTTYDINNDTDRAAMIVQARSALTTSDCTQALTLSTQLYQSTYSNDEIRMLYASAQACNVGIQLYTLISDIGNSDFSSTASTFRALVKLFPSRQGLDSKLQSTWFAQDALQSILNIGAVIAPANLTYSTSNNPGSTISIDRTTDANIYLAFMSMAVIGTTLNQYGYNITDDPASLGYHPTVTLPWTTTSTVQNDTTGAACALASGFLNMFDGITSLAAAVTGSTSSALSSIVTLFGATVSNQGIAQACVLIDNSMTLAQYEAAVARLRYRGACSEQKAAAVAAGAINSVIASGWQ